jgi:hypothetical protein
MSFTNKNILFSCRNKFILSIVTLIVDCRQSYMGISVLFARFRPNNAMYNTRISPIFASTRLSPNANRVGITTYT